MNLQLKQRFFSVKWKRLLILTACLGLFQGVNSSQFKSMNTTRGIVFLTVFTPMYSALITGMAGGATMVGIKLDKN